MMHSGNPVLDHPGFNGFIHGMIVSPPNPSNPRWHEDLINFGELERAVESFRPRAKCQVPTCRLQSAKEAESSIAN